MVGIMIVVSHCKEKTILLFLLFHHQKYIFATDSVILTKTSEINKSIMVNKKYLLLAGLFAVATAQPVFAQESGNGTAGSTGASYQSRDMTYRGESYDPMDTTVVPGRRMEQHRKFLNHQYNF